jgi:hypothetical protein
VLAHLPSPREPVLLEQLDRRAEQEPALSFAAGGGLGDRFDKAASSGGNLLESALESGSCDPLATMALVDEYAGDPPARRRRWVLAILTAVPELELVRAAVLAPALCEPLLIEDQRCMRVAGPHELLLQCAGIADPSLVRRVKCDAPAASVDPIVAFDQLRECAPCGCVERPGGVPHCGSSSVCALPGPFRTPQPPASAGGLVRPER